MWNFTKKNHSYFKTHANFDSRNGEWNDPETDDNGDVMKDSDGNVMVKCPVCLDEFPGNEMVLLHENEPNKPIKHGICKSCYEKYVVTSRPPKCPSCMEQITIPGPATNRLKNLLKTERFEQAVRELNDGTIQDDEINQRMEDDMTPLLFTLAEDKVTDNRLAKALIRRGADVNATDNKNQTALVYVLDGRARENDFDMVKTLLENDADPTIYENFYGYSALHWALFNQRNASIIKLLLDYIDVNWTSDENDEAAIHVFAGHTWSSESSDVLNLLVEKGANFDTEDTDGFLPLHIAAGEGDLEMLKRMFEYSPEGSVNRRTGEESLFTTYDDFEWTLPLHQVVARFGTHTPKHWHSELEQMALFLIDNGADINAKDRNGNTVIHLLAEKTPNYLLGKFLNANPNLTIKNNDNQTAYDIAFSKLQIINKQPEPNRAKRRRLETTASLLKPYK